METSAAYFDLLKKTLTGYIYPESADKIIEKHCGRSPRAVIINLLVTQAAKRGIQLIRRHPFDATMREEGRDQPSIGYSMAGLKRLDNAKLAIETALKENIPGDVIECGVWRGGCSIYMSAVLQANKSDRTLWLADSFEGLPKPNAVKYPADKGDTLYQREFLSVPIETVKENFRRFGLLSDSVKFLKGWFKDTLPVAPIKQIAVLRADGDMYESTIDILANLYWKVSPGGFVIIDDYYNWQNCRQAVTEFRERNKIKSTLVPIDRDAVYWRA